MDWIQLAYIRKRQFISLSKLYKKKIPRDDAIKLLKQFINDETPSKTTNFEISILEDHNKERCFKRL